MSIRIPVMCPRCETILTLLDRSKLGTWVKCASCEQVFVSSPAAPLESLIHQSADQQLPQDSSFPAEQDDSSYQELDSPGLEDVDDDSDSSDSASSSPMSPVPGGRPKSAGSGQGVKKKKKSKQKKSAASTGVNPLLLAVVGLLIVIVVLLVVIAVLVTSTPSIPSPPISQSPPSVPAPKPAPVVAPVQPPAVPLKPGESSRE